MTDKPPRRRMLRFLLFSVAALALVVALLAGVFAMMHFQANAVRLPAELQKPPLDLLAEGEGDTRAMAGGGERVSRAGVEEVHDYESFLRARSGANFRNSAAGAYVELMHDLEATSDSYNDLENSYYKTFPHLFRDPITTRQQDWLTSHAALLERLRHLARAEGALPGVTMREELESGADGRTEYYSANRGILRFAQKILLQQARTCAQQGNYANATETLADALRLPLQLRADDHPFARVNTLHNLSYSEAVLHSWLADPAFPSAALMELVNELDRAEDLLFPSDSLVHALKAEYLNTRYWIVETMKSGTWHNSVYGWHIPTFYHWIGDPPDEIETKAVQKYRELYEAPSGYWEWRINLPENLGGPWLILRLDRFGAKALGAMRNRRHSAEALRDFDRIWRAWIVAAERDGSTAHAGITAEEVTNNFILREYYPFASYDVAEIEIPLRQAEAALRLARLGVRWRIDPEATQALQHESPLSTPHHPWRDPFTGQPVHTARTTSQTLIYSVGPDRTDQHGAMEYDRQRGLHSPGDIVIRLPQERGK